MLLDEQINGRSYSNRCRSHPTNLFSNLNVKWNFSEHNELSCCFPAVGVCLLSVVIAPRAYQTSSHQPPKHKQLILWNLFQQQIYCMFFVRGESSSSSQLHKFSFFSVFIFLSRHEDGKFCSPGNALHLNDINRRSVAQRFDCCSFFSDYPNVFMDIKCSEFVKMLACSKIIQRSSKNGN